MENLEETFGKLLRSVEETNKELMKGGWKEMSRAVFVNSLENNISSLKESKRLLLDLRFQLSKLDKNAPDLSNVVADFDKTIGILEKNFRMEKNKRETGDATILLTSKQEIPELYASLEQKILTLLLKSRYSLEQLGLFLKKENITPLNERTTADGLIEVLKKREEELNEIKDNFEKLKRKSYFGYLQEENPADIEKELHELSKKLESRLGEMRQTYSLHEERIDKITGDFSNLKEKIKNSEEIFDRFAEKSEELIRILKKERDYAKKVVLETEGETGRVRHAYTKEILGLQEAKIRARQEAEEKYRKTIETLKKDVKEKDSLVKDFREMLSRRERKLEELEAKGKHLRLLLKTKEKHEAIKRHFSRRKSNRKE